MDSMDPANSVDTESQDTSNHTQVAKPKESSNDTVHNLADLLPLYYQRLFPFTNYWRWLSYGSASVFSRREFSFTIKDDVYIRYRSFAILEDLQHELKRLTPFKIDIGAIYNVSPKDEARFANFSPVERELIFDIDMTDYDDVRTCCTGASVCTKCWKFMVIACTILDTALRDDFGYEHLLWVFSGRRGIHCWVCDKQARKLQPIIRSSIAEYLQLLSGGEMKAKKVNLPGRRLHHSVQRALNVIEPMFVQMCVEEQNMLGTEKTIEAFLALFHDEEMRSRLRDLFRKYSTSSERWEAFKSFWHSEETSGKQRRNPHLMEEIMLQYTYPRLDIHVTKGMNHLLKSPFCVHPKSGKISVPFNPKAVAKFDPQTVPTIELLIGEINAYDAKESQIHEANTRTNVKDYKKTSLNKAIHIFEEFIRKLNDAARNEKAKLDDSTMEF